MNNASTLQRGDLVTFSHIDAANKAHYLAYHPGWNNNNQFQTNPAKLRTHFCAIETENEQRIPNNFYSRCIFQIEIGPGFEAAGETVRYGSSIRLVLWHWKKFMCSSNDGKVLAFDKNLTVPGIFFKLCFSYI